MIKDLIYDLGMHDGADTAYYLSKGFRVVAVEADPALAQSAALRFARPLAAKRLVVVNKAVAAKPGRVVLHRVENSIWSTLEQDRVELAARKGSSHSDVEVEATTSADLLREFGVPYYIKIDIEGLDTTALRGLSDLEERPPFVSIESERRDLRSIREELRTFTALGYHQFKVVAQHRVQYQREPVPVREGIPAGPPVAESSGLFGNDLPGRWLNASEAVDAYRRPLLNHYLTGSDAIVKSRWMRAVLKRSGFRPGWYDTHAKLGSPAPRTCPI
jgi:FkbM family methyltransferase